MKCEPCTFLPESEVGCLQTSFWGTTQSSQSSGNHTPARSCENVPQMDGSPTCECGKGMSECSIHPNTPEKWIASMRDSLAKILALPANKQGLAKKREAASIAKSSASLGWFDPATCSWKTSQQSFLTDSEPSSMTWPRSGMTRNGYAYELPIVGRIITGTDGGAYVPTPTATDCKSETMSIHLVSKRKEESTRGVRLSEFLIRGMIPTPNAGGSHWNGRLDELGGSNNVFRGSDIGKLRLNPVWIEIIQGFPPGFTDSKDWETRKSQSRRRSHGNFSEVRK